MSTCQTFKVRSIGGDFCRDCGEPRARHPTPRSPSGVDLNGPIQELRWSAQLALNWIDDSLASHKDDREFMVERSMANRLRQAIAKMHELMPL